MTPCAPIYARGHQNLNFFICPEYAYLNVLPFQVDKSVYICSEVFIVVPKQVLLSDVRLLKRNFGR